MATNIEKRNFWSKRSNLKELAGTNDFMLKELEEKKIMDVVKPGSRVLDIGCGDGHVLIELSRKKGCTGIGIDFSEGMVRLANFNNKSSKIKFLQYDMKKLSEDLGKFDYIITKRSVCNLDNANEQKRVFLSIMSLLKKGGHYLMMEDFEEGLDKVNALRKMLKLKAIEMPWHNVFLSEKKVKSWGNKRYILREIDQLSGAYYFLSRVVYAKLNEGKNLKYDSEINKLSMLLPQDLTDACVTKLYLWRRN